LNHEDRSRSFAVIFSTAAAQDLWHKKKEGLTVNGFSSGLARLREEAEDRSLF
jgi:hypothetical protein